MATLQEQYLLIKEGKGHKDVFMKQALRQFPNLVTQSSTFKQISTILKQKGLITENYIDLQPINVVSNPQKEDYELKFEKFLSEEKNYTKSSQEVDIKADSKKSSKSADEYKEKSYHEQYEAKTGDNVIFGQLIKGIQFEMDKPENEEKSLEDIRKIVLKNLAKDPIYYTKNAAFGVEGAGYTDQIPGFKPSKTDKMEAISKEKIKSNVQDSLGKKESKKGTPKQIKQELGFIPKSSKGVKKMALPGKEKKIKLKENFDISGYPREEVFLYLEDAKEVAEKISREEGVVQHVNQTLHGYKIEDWYDSDSTVASFENGMQINESFAIFKNKNNTQPKWVNMFDLENAVKKEFISKGRQLSKDEIDEFIKKQLPKINQGEGKYKKSVEALAKEMFKINESVNNITIKQIIREELSNILEEISSLDHYLEGLNNHDFFYKFSDDEREYDKGKDSEMKLQVLYNSLSEDDKEQAFEAWREQMNLHFPQSADYWNSMNVDQFKGI